MPSYLCSISAIAFTASQALRTALLMLSTFQFISVSEKVKLVLSTGRQTIGKVLQIFLAISEHLSILGRQLWEGNTPKCKNLLNGIKVEFQRDSMASMF